MLTADEVLEYTGHAVGGVCGFGIESDAVDVYSDVSMQRFETVFPACGSSNSAIEFTCDELFKYSKSVEWIDVCKIPEEEQ
jgi:prolyl-tRNA editing enzyme YbaK/EbsC (Cys-tRNA(Pro) deacylase)